MLVILRPNYRFHHPHPSSPFGFIICIRVIMAFAKAVEGRREIRIFLSNHWHILVRKWLQQYRCVSRIQLYSINQPFEKNAKIKQQISKPKMHSRKSDFRKKPKKKKSKYEKQKKCNGKCKEQVTCLLLFYFIFCCFIFAFFLFFFPKKKQNKSKKKGKTWFCFLFALFLLFFCFFQLLFFCMCFFVCFLFAFSNCFFFAFVG